MKKSINNALSEEEQELVLQGLLSRKIWRFYELLAKWAPIPLMLGHWYGVGTMGVIQDLPYLIRLITEIVSSGFTFWHTCICQSA